jgi:hypothetical protein
MMKKKTTKPTTDFSFWKQRFLDAGFSVKGRQAVRTLDKIQHSVGLQKGMYHEGAFKINLNILVHDPFTGPGYFFVCLNGHVEPNSILQMEEHAWWSPEELNDAMNVFFRIGLPWFDEFASDVNQLSIWLSKAIKQNRSVEVVKYPSLHLKGPHGEGYLPIYDYALSLLKFFQGDLRGACAHAKRWGGRFSPSAEDAVEPTRTVRQIKEMGCDSERGGPNHLSERN